MIWSIYAQLGQNMWFKEEPKLDFDDEAWEQLIDSAVENGFNQIVLDLGEGVQYGSHPELAKEGAWTRQRVRQEVKRCHERGIDLIPKLNFSATHHLWMGEYRKMMSTTIYYQVCRDLIEEVYSLFDKPTYIHIGMDEEDDPQFFECRDLVSYRQGELLWHDLQYLCDCVRDCGSIPWIWADTCMYHPEEFRKHISCDQIVISPWIYVALRPEHRDPKLAEREEAPIWATFAREGVIAANDGYKTVPCCSIWGGNEYCSDDVVEHFWNNCNHDNIIGYMTAPWIRTNNESIEDIKRSMRLLAAAREKFCK